MANNTKKEPLTVKTELVGVSRNIEKIRGLIERVADTNLNVIIIGETGVGKEVVAQQLYEKSNRFGKPFVKINCAALPETLLESEMFGYERGAFTGAHRTMRGKFEQANHGVLFLDEIGDMPISLQSKLLHALQDGDFSRLGSETTRKSNAWVIAATNQDLKKAQKEGKFRTDLYHRLNTITIPIDPLRRRPEDIPHLIKYYAEKYTEQLGPKKTHSLSTIVIETLVSYQWPGNVRELQNVLRRLILLGETVETVKEITGSTGLDQHYPTNFRKDSNSFSWMEYFGLNNGGRNHHEELSLKKISKKAALIIEKEVISHVLIKTGWNRSKAVKFLDISYRSLLKKIKELDLKPPTALI